jgi:hypothetical protein
LRLYLVNLITCLFKVLTYLITMNIADGWALPGRVGLVLMRIRVKSYLSASLECSSKLTNRVNMGTSCPAKGT